MTGIRTFVLELPEDLRWDLEVQKTVHESMPYYVPGFVEANFSDTRIIITFKSKKITDKELYHDLLDLVDRISRSFRDAKVNLLYQSTNKLNIISRDPFKSLSNSRAVVSTGHGKFIYGKEFLTVFEAVDEKIAGYCLSKNAEKELYPTTIETDTLIQSGYLKLSPHLAYFVAPVHLDQAGLVKMGGSDILLPEKREETVLQLGIPDQVMAPTVCYHCFEARKNSDISEGLITSLNKCHRHESVDVSSLERLTTYWMRELIVFGLPSDVQECLDDTLAWTTSLLDEWGAWYEVVSANDPFFGDMGAGNRLFQTAFLLKRELKMPVFSGRKVAVASFNNHQQSLVDKFDITSSEYDKTLTFSSGCIGWGYERLIYSLFCQFGEELSDWPSVVKRSLNL